MSAFRKAAVVTGVVAAGAGVTYLVLRDKPTTPGSVAPPPPTNRLVVPGNMVVKETGSMEPGVPVAVTLHGIGGSEEQLVPYATAPLFRFVHVRGPLKSGKGFQYMKSKLAQSDPAAFIAEAKTVVEYLRPVFQAIAALNPAEVFVVGYSQGGHIAWMLAEAQLVDRALIIAGGLPASYRPQGPHQTTRIHAMGGAKDNVVKWASVLATADNFSAAGYVVSRSQRTGAGHAISGIGPALNDGLVSLLEPASPNPAAPSPKPPLSPNPSPSPKPGGLGVGAPKWAGDSPVPTMPKEMVSPFRWTDNCKPILHTVDMVSAWCGKLGASAPMGLTTAQYNEYGFRSALGKCYPPPSDAVSLWGKNLVPYFWEYYRRYLAGLLSGKRLSEAAAQTMADAGLVWLKSKGADTGALNPHVVSRY